MTSPGNPPIYSSVAAGSAVPAPTPLNPSDDIEARVAAVVEARLSDIENKYQDRIKALEDQLKTARQPSVGVLAQHAGGPNYNLAPTWSQRLQELARDGKLTEQVLLDAGYAAEDLAGLL